LSRTRSSALYETNTSVDGLPIAAPSAMRRRRDLYVSPAD
jgi:hypothetical protein